MATPIKSARKLAQEIRVARNLTQERLKKILRYDPETGVFTWTKALVNGLKRGRVAGRIIGNGERIIKVFGVNFPASSLAFLYMNGNWPTGSLAFLCMKGNWPRNRVEYVNGDKSDTSWGNLGAVTRPASTRNPLARPRATYGVYEREEGSWEVRAWQNGKWADIGTFPSENAASGAARAALLSSKTEAIADKAPEYRIKNDKPANKAEAIADEVPIDKAEAVADEVPIDNVEPTTDEAPIDELPIVEAEPISDEVPVDNAEPIVDEVPIEVFAPIADDSTKDTPPVLGE